NLRHHTFETLNGYRTFLTGAEQAAQHLVSAEFFPATVLLNDDERSFFHHFERCKPSLAAFTLSAPANRFVIVRGPRVQHFRTVKISVWTSHASNDRRSRHFLNTRHIRAGILGLRSTRK